jgi:hypothetical protein
MVIGRQSGRTGSVIAGNRAGGRSFFQRIGCLEKPMRSFAPIVFAAASLLLGLSTVVRADDERHAPDAHMDQNADRYRYDYDDGVCSYRYEYDFKTLKDTLDQKGDCRNVPIQRYRPQAAITPAYPPPAAAPPATAPGQAAAQAAPSVIVGQPAPQPQTRAPAGITVQPVQ